MADEEFLEEFLIEEVEDYSMKMITRTVLQGSVIAGVAFMLAAMSTMPTARHAYAQDTSADASDGSASADTVFDVAGSWSGSIIDDSLGSGDITLSITQKGPKIDGGWMTTFTTASFLGSFDGKVTSKGAKLELSSGSFERKDCKVKFTASTVSGTEISGSYKYVNCGKQFKGDKGGKISVTPTPPS